MSWSIYVPEPINSVIDITQESQGQDLDEVKDQADAAKTAIQGIIDSGVVGDGPYRVSLGGHANPEHKPQEGWANDTVSVSVAQA